MKKQTAVEWLVRELMKSKDYQRVINDVNHSGTEEKDIINQAKEMERAQILRANLAGLIDDKRLIEMDGNKTVAKMLNYYDQTFL